MTAPVLHKTPEQIAEEFGEANEIVFTSEHKVACDGGGGALGHPKTFYTINDEGYARCGYCDRIFIWRAE